MSEIDPELLHEAMCFVYAQPDGVAVSSVEGGEIVALAIHQDRQRSAWQPIETAPKDGTIVNVVGRYPDATAGFPRYAGFQYGQWLEFSRNQPEPLVCWAWRPRDDWPAET